MQGDAQDVVVHTWIYAGNSTEREDVVWADGSEVGTIGGGGFTEAQTESNCRFNRQQRRRRINHYRGYRRRARRDCYFPKSRQSKLN